MTTQSVVQGAIEAELPFLRAEAEARMTDTFTAYKPVRVKIGGLDQDDWAEQYVTAGRVSGKSREGDTNVRTINIGGLERLVLEGGLHIPISKPLPEVGWEFACTAVGAISDPSLLSRRWRVVNVPAKSQATARRLDVVEVDPQEA